MTELLAIGGAHIDRTARMIEPHIPGASNPVTFSQTIGGGAFNAARVAKLRHVTDIAIMSVRGGDAGGDQVEHEIERRNMADFSGTFMDRATPSYTAILDVDGELVTALADMALYDYGFERQVRRKECRGRISAARALLMDANLPEAAIENVCDSANGPIFAMCISPAKARRLASSLQSFHTLFLNQRELHALSDLAGPLATSGIRRAVITNGTDAIEVFEGGSMHRVNVPIVEPVVDVTGAGDALTGGTIAAFLCNPDKPLRECVMEGVACAQLALQVSGPLCDPIHENDFETALTRVTAAQ